MKDSDFATQAVTERRSRFNFMGKDIRLVPTCGVFVTMNSRREGRSTLPDNLKALLRPVQPMQACLGTWCMPSCAHTRIWYMVYAFMSSVELGG